MSLAVISPLFGQNSYQQSVKKKQTDKCCTTAQSITPKEVKIMPLRIKKSQTGKQKRKKNLTLLKFCSWCQSQQYLSHKKKKKNRFATSTSMKEGLFCKKAVAVCSQSRIEMLIRHFCSGMYNVGFPSPKNLTFPGHTLDGSFSSSYSL